MAITIQNITIEKVCIVDDDDASRNIWELAVDDSKLKSVLQEESVSNVDTYLTSFSSMADAIVSDHHLKKKNYFPVNGAEFISKCYRRRIPSVLVTKYEKSELNEIRKFRKWIPTVLTPDDFVPETLIKSFELCIKEFHGTISSERREWRTLLRIDDVLENGNFFVIIPAWNRNETISINMKDLPSAIRNAIKSDARLHAKVNLGASSSNELYFTDWEDK